MKRVLVAVCLLVACKAERRATSAAVRAETAAPQTASSTAISQPALRMIIRNATISVIVRDAVDALNRITSFVEAKRGYVAETRQWKEREQVRATATVRVPAAQLSAALAAIRRIAIRIETENVPAQD